MVSTTICGGVALKIAREVHDRAHAFRSFCHSWHRDRQCLRGGRGPNLSLHIYFSRGERSYLEGQSRSRIANGCEKRQEDGMVFHASERKSAESHVARCDLQCCANTEMDSSMQH